MKLKFNIIQFQAEKQLLVVIRNVPIPITEDIIFKELKELDFEIDTVTCLQNRFKNSIPIVAVLLKKSSPNIYSLNRLLHCVVSVEPRNPSTGILQCTNCQKFSHIKNVVTYGLGALNAWAAITIPNAKKFWKLPLNSSTVTAIIQLVTEVARFIYTF